VLPLFTKNIDSITIDIKKQCLLARKAKNGLKLNIHLDSMITLFLKGKKKMAKGVQNQTALGPVGMGW
jgi:hypothetical protein